MSESPFEAVISASLENLPPIIRDLHAGHGERRFSGRVSVTSGSGVARLVGRIAGFPPSMQDAPMRLVIRPDERGEIWVRHFSEHRTVSHLWAERGVLRERFGPVTSGLVPQYGGGTLSFRTGRASVFGIPLPTGLRPEGEVRITTERDVYHFDIIGAVPILGRVIRYVGWLRRDVT